MIDTLIDMSEFEQKPHREKERKYLPLFPESLERFRPEARPIEQFYLSHPSEDFNLRFRESFANDGSLRYEATLKDRGEITAEGLDRLEVTAEVSPETYEFYKTDELPIIRKLRTEANANVSIDFFEDGRVVAESEHPIAWSSFLDQHSLGASFVEVTGDRTADNEWNAHLDYRRKNNGKEAFTVSPDLSVPNMAIEILNTSARSSQVIVQIAGRSGSGKSTLIRELEHELQTYNLNTVCLSTDDYHRGTTWLNAYNRGVEWTDWDAPIVYDTTALVEDIHTLKNGKEVARRTINFSVCEPVYSGTVGPAPVIIVEGIYARSPEIAQISDLGYELPTPLATCIGRRLLRDMKERPQFADPETSLRYMLENAEPAYRSKNIK